MASYLGLIRWHKIYTGISVLACHLLKLLFNSYLNSSLLHTQLWHITIIYNTVITACFHFRISSNSSFWMLKVWIVDSKLIKKYTQKKGYFSLTLSFTSIPLSKFRAASLTWPILCYFFTKNAKSRLHVSFISFFYYTNGKIAT